MEGWKWKEEQCHRTGPTYLVLTGKSVALDLACPDRRGYGYDVDTGERRQTCRHRKRCSVCVEVEASSLAHGSGPGTTGWVGRGLGRAWVDGEVSASTWMRAQSLNTWLGERMRGVTGEHGEKE